MLPNRLIAQAYLSRGAQLWLVTRVTLSGVFLLAGTDPLQLSGAAVVGISLLSVVLSFLETWRRRESALLANLGIRPLVVGACFAWPAVFGEIALHLGGAAFR
ncbi:MAG: hypothetical protein IT359_18305 [Gemmatimonadaceae bacterium]|nr:hypothetical protein [Gemmatimonadaceae bacterium]